MSKLEKNIYTKTNIILKKLYRIKDHDDDLNLFFNCDNFSFSF